MKQLASKKSILLAATLLTSPLIALSAVRPTPGVAPMGFDALEPTLQIAQRVSAQVDPSTLGTTHFDFDPCDWGVACRPHGGR